MADTSETETSLSDDAEDFRNGSSTQPLLQLETCSTRSVPDSEVADAGLHALEHTTQKVNSTNHGGWSPENTLNREAAAGSSAGTGKSAGPVKFPKPKLDLRALFDYHSRRRQYRLRKRLEAARGTGCKGPRNYTKRLRVKLTRAERRRRYNDRGYQFPFVQKLYRIKHLPLKLVCLYEQGALEGYFKYIKMLKYEHHLKKSLKELDAGEELENECLESRKYKYLDDDGPLSPIEETNGDDQKADSGEEDIGVEIVDKSSFILSSTIPKKKKSKKLD
uniref:TATA box-binding protein-associated factor RNA polymerase I subunit D n=1 Tax=Pogona vitticeps TaxID=103695 RepID=A0ABM5FWA2_9SAUR